jgi:Mn-dependent DtxR family transcriptional regulator
MEKLTKAHLRMVEAKRATVVDISRITGVSKQEITQMLKKCAEENKKAKSVENTLFGE